MKNPRYVLVRRRTTGEKTRDVLEVQDLLKDVVIKRISLVSNPCGYVHLSKLRRLRNTNYRMSITVVNQTFEVDFSKY